MRYFLLLTIVWGLWAQGVLPVSVSEAAGAKPIIKADSSYFDINTGLHILKGNVYIEIRNQKITAGQAKASLATLEIWGAGGVTFTLDDMYLTADSVHVISARSRAIIEGRVSFNRGDLMITADQADLNWSTKLTLFKGNVTVIKGDETRTMDAVTYNVETNSLQ